MGRPFPASFPGTSLSRFTLVSCLVSRYRSRWLPFFLVRDVPVELEARVEDPLGAANIVRALRDLGATAAVLLCNPVPEDLAMDRRVVAAASEACVELAAREGVQGKALTPYLLSCLAERTGGRSLEANLALLEANARLAGEVAAAAT